MYRIVVFFIFLFISFPVSSYDLIKGDNVARAGDSFTVPLRIFMQDQVGDVVYGAAAIPGGKSYSISCVGRDTPEFKAIALEKATVVNGQKEEINPLYDKEISHLLSLTPHALVTVLAEVPTQMYLVALKDVNQLQTITPIDAFGKKNGGIIALAGDGKGTTCMAIKGHEQGRFGGDGSGIATVSFYEKEVKKEASKEKADEKAEKKETQKVWVFEQRGMTAALVDNHPAICLKNSASIQEFTDIHWDTDLNVVYIALKAQAGSASDEGVRAIIVGHYNDQNQLVLLPLAPASIFKSGAQKEIIGALGASAVVTIHAVRTMTASSMLNYLIVHGGNDQHASKRLVYALPLVNMREKNGKIPVDKNCIHGTLAKVDGAIQEAFSDNKAQIFWGRHFVTPAETAGDIFTSDSPAACVGNGPLQAGEIDKIMVKDDTVFAVVKARDDMPGAIYYSQPIFNCNGTILVWTEWQKAFMARDLQTALFEGQQGNFFIGTGTDGDYITGIKRTRWHDIENDQEPLSSLINSIFAPENGGVHGLFEVSYPISNLHNKNMMMVTGAGAITLIDTDRALPGFERSCQMINAIIFKQAEVETSVTPETTVVTFAGDTLKSLGVLTSAEIVTDVNQAWLVVGGTLGIAVLINPDGSGWPCASGLLPDLQELSVGMKFVRCGSYEAVRKLIANGDYLYILTDTTFERIDVPVSSFMRNSLDTTLLFNIPRNEPTMLFDAIVSEKFAVLATSKGLLRIGNGADVSSAKTIQEACWTPVVIPGSSYPPIFLFPVSIHGRVQDIARDTAGQLYVVSGYLGKNSAYVNRFVIKSVEGTEVTDATLQPLLDWRVKDHNGPALNFGEYRDQFATDGTLYMHARSRHINNRVEVANKQGRAKYISPFNFEKASCITALKRCKTTGAWMVAGDFGLQIQH